MIDKQRRRTEAPLPEDEGPAFVEDGADALGLLLNDERNAELWRAFRLLADDDQELLRLHLLDALDYGELAEVLGRSQGALRVAVFRARGRLRQAYESLSPSVAEGEVLL
jgi:RNA polymerase sigma-70 factor (ECF subfamily)